MKHLIILITGLFVLSGILAPCLTAQDSAAYISEFNSYNALRDRFGVVQDAVKAGGSATEFYVHALNRLVLEYQNLRGATDIRIAADMATALARQLGEEGHTEAGPKLWALVETMPDPLVKAEALTALGRVQAVDYLPQVVQILTDINSAPSEDRTGQENIAVGAIRSLEAYKDSSGYLPVFFASTGWYSQRVKDRAKEALPRIMDNPAESLTSVIKGSSYNYAVKYAALQALEAAELTAQLKAAGAVASLSEAWRTSTSTVGQRSILTNTRKLALNMIRRYGTEDANVYPLLERCYKEGSDTEEQIAAVAALSALATDDSATRLSSFLMDINERLRRGTLTQEDERLVRVIIPALGNTGRPSARPALSSVMRFDWTGAVQRLAQEALKKIQ
ncbi:MAG: hypothetical protein LBQ44_10165 [Treponema sp.]|nr:hypothetical protein [Treponema sp.]